MRVTNRRMDGRTMTELRQLIPRWHSSSRGENGTKRRGPIHKILDSAIVSAVQDYHAVIDVLTMCY